MNGSVVVGIWVTISGFEALRGHVARHRLSPDIKDHFPDRTRRHDAAVGGHAARPALKEGLEQCAGGAAVTPTAVDETRSPPAGRATPVAAVAVHRAEN